MKLELIDHLSTAGRPKSEPGTVEGEREKKTADWLLVCSSLRGAPIKPSLTKLLICSWNSCIQTTHALNTTPIRMHYNTCLTQALWENWTVSSFTFVKSLYASDESIALVLILVGVIVTLWGIFAFLPMVEWEDWCHFHLCMLDMMLQPVSLAYRMDWKQEETASQPLCSQW